MSDHDYWSRRLAEWRAGDQTAATDVFRHFAERLVLLVRSRLSATLTRRIDPEDVVQSACRSFFLKARDGGFGTVRDEELWGILAIIAIRKLRGQVRLWTRQKRDVRREQSVSAAMTEVDVAALDREPSPVEAAMLLDTVENLMRSAEPAERTILEMRLQGHSLEEIAGAANRSQRTVIRVLNRVKQQLLRQTAAVEEVG